MAIATILEIDSEQEVRKIFFRNKMARVRDGRVVLHRTCGPVPTPVPVDAAEQMSLQQAKSILDKRPGFALFPYLPYEIRRQIWEYCWPEHDRNGQHASIPTFSLLGRIGVSCLETRQPLKEKLFRSFRTCAESRREFVRMFRLGFIDDLIGVSRRQIECNRMGVFAYMPREIYYAKLPELWLRSDHEDLKVMETDRNWWDLAYRMLYNEPKKKDLKSIIREILSPIIPTRGRVVVFLKLCPVIFFSLLFAWHCYDFMFLRQNLR
ncbi:hypothetical protein B0J14DRAFT_566155 [Halenospora varia]|nr:hypothetical protein B0J14DRAFT_566155 [Halenospora varia]